MDPRYHQPDTAQQANIPQQPDIPQQPETALLSEAAQQEDILQFAETELQPDAPSPSKASIPPSPYMLRLQDHFPLYGSFSLLLALLSAACFFRNPHGLSYPLFIAAAYLSAWQIIKSLGFAGAWDKPSGSLLSWISARKAALFPPAAALLLALNTCFTASRIIHSFNNLAQILLGGFFLLYLCFNGPSFTIGKYIRSLAGLLLHALGALPLPLLHGRRFFRNVKSTRSRSLLMLLSGFLISLPVLFYLSLLLADADAVFRTILQNGLAELLHSSAIPDFFFLFLFSFLCCYCLMGSLCSGKIRTFSGKAEENDTENSQQNDPENGQKNSPENSPKSSRKNPLPAISFCTMLCLLYLFFCGIQVFYLFAGKGTLPQGMTYSAYARQGFFQLLAVALINLFLVLAILNYFRRHPVLTGCLTVISLCTGVLLGSSAFRMCLYVDAYGLTFLRLAVLWFLALTAVVLAGILLALFRKAFPLFSWCFVSASIAYCAFAWSIPDLQIARYNIAREGGFITTDNISYLLTSLSADAAPALAEAQIDDEVWGIPVALPQNRYHSTVILEKWQMLSCLQETPWYAEKGRGDFDLWLEATAENLRFWEPGIRTYNHSLAQAGKLALEALNESKTKADPAENLAENPVQTRHKKGPYSLSPKSTESSPISRIW